MHYAFDEDQETYAQEVRKFAVKTLARTTSPMTRPPSSGAAGARHGGLGPDRPAHPGGVRRPGRDGRHRRVAAEEVGREDFNAGYLIINTALISDIIVRNATDDQKAAWLPGIAAGETVPCICITEPGHGTDAASLELKATTADGEGWTLHGEKTSITLGMAADRAVVLARTGGPGARGVSAFWVDLHHPSVSRSAFDDLGSRAIGRASLHFDGTPVSRGADRRRGRRLRLGHAGPTTAAIIGLFCIGAAQASLDEAIQWSRDREAFGSPIGTFQGVSFPLAEAATPPRAPGTCAWRPCGRDTTSSTARSVPWLFWAPKLATEVIHQCLLTIGHIGYSSEHKVGQRLRDVIGLEIGDGTAQVSKLVISRHLLGRKYAP